MTDFFSFARLNLLNVLICTAKKNFDSDFPSLLKQPSFFAPGPSGDSRETRFIHEWRFIHAKRHAGSKEVRLLSQATIFLPRVLMYQTFWWSTKTGDWELLWRHFRTPDDGVWNRHVFCNFGSIVWQEHVLEKFASCDRQRHSGQQI